MIDRIDKKRMVDYSTRGKIVHVKCTFCTTSKIARRHSLTNFNIVVRIARLRSNMHAYIYIDPHRGIYILIVLKIVSSSKLRRSRAFLMHLPPSFSWNPKIDKSFFTSCRVIRCRPVVIRKEPTRILTVKMWK